MTSYHFNLFGCLFCFFLFWFWWSSFTYSPPSWFNCFCLAWILWNWRVAVVAIFDCRHGRLAGKHEPLITFQQVDIYIHIWDVLDSSSKQLILTKKRIKDWNYWLYGDERKEKKISGGKWPSPPSRSVKHLSVLCRVCSITNRLDWKKTTLQTAFFHNNLLLFFQLVFFFYFPCKKWLKQKRRRQNIPWLDKRSQSVGVCKWPFFKRPRKRGLSVS